MMEALNIYSKNSIIRYYSQKNLRIKKQLGQNFLINADIVRKIIDIASIKDTKTVIEIGAGLGSITRLLCENSQLEKVHAIEKDKDFLAPLELIKKDFNSKLELHFVDFKGFQLDSFCQDVKIIGNLPYNSATFFINRFMELQKFFHMTFTIQLELANRICAKVSSKDYGYLSVLAQSFFKCEKHIEITSDNFFPEPKVCSAVISMIPNAQIISPGIYNCLKKILNSVFSKRRKMLSVSLKSSIPCSVNLLNKIDINPCLRPQDVCVQKYVEFAKLLESRI